MIKRTQSLYGTLFTVSGVVCAFRKIAVMEAGLWTPEAMTDDVDLTLRVQAKGWAVGFEPHAICWILMPETLADFGNNEYVGPKAVHKPPLARLRPFSNHTPLPGHYS